MEQLPRYVAQGESSKVCLIRRSIYVSHTLGFQSLLVFYLPLASHYVPPILLCSLRRLMAILSFLAIKSP